MSVNEFIWPEGEELTFVRPPKEEYNGKLENFYSPDSFPELAYVKENWKVIRDEVLEYERNHGNLAGQNAVNVAGVAGEPWTLLYLKSFNRQFPKNKKKFPKTAAIFDSIPNVVFAAVSILPPKTKILPHHGDTNGIVRSHLGLVIPAPYPDIAIKVREEERGWEEGEIFCFINVHRHEVWNNTNERRYILLFDFVPKPLQHRILEICSKGLGSQSYNALYVKFGWYRKLPKFFHDINIWAFTQIWKIYLLTLGPLLK